MKPDDKPAFEDPPAGFEKRRDNIPQGKLELIEYESKTVGTTRKMQVYTPPGYSKDKRYPVLFLLHGIGGDETEWQRFATPDVMPDNLIADVKAVPMIIPDCAVHLRNLALHTDSRDLTHPCHATPQLYSRISG